MNSKIAAVFNFTEFEECVRFVNYLDVLMMQGKVIRYTHIPNETFTTFKSVKMKNKRMGVNPGFPDYIIILRAKIICVEMKRAKGGTVSPEQILWIKDLTERGVASYVCKGFDEARKVVEQNL